MKIALCRLPPRRLHVFGLALALVSIGVAPGLGDESSPCRPGDRGRLLRVVRVASHPTAADAREYFDSWVDFYRDFFGFPPRFPVDIDHGFDTYKVTYCTVDAVLPGRSTAMPTAATGNISVPRKPGPLSTVVYLHGTSVSFYDAPSNPNIFGDVNENGESFDGPVSSATFAGGGFIYIAPDYLGLGDSTVPRHRYFHAATEASSAVDLLAASRHVLAGLRVQRSRELFLFGFSQGGHAALALHRALQNQRVDVTATATTGGVFDIERFFLLSLANETVAFVPLYVSYILLAYDDVYDVYGEPSDVFRREFAPIVPGLFDMQHFFDDVVAGLPTTARALLRPSYFAALHNDPDIPLRRRLRQNAVDRWRAEAPIRVYHSPDDEEVDYGAALESVERLRNRGGDVSVRTVPGDHVTSWVRAMPRAVAYFKTLQ